MKKVLAGQPGPLPGNWRTVALDGNGNINVGRHDEFALINDFTLEAWMCIGERGAIQQGDFGYGRRRELQERSSDGGWALAARHNDRGADSPPGLYFTACSVQGLSISRSAAGETIMNRWLHVAVVYDHFNTAHLYLNGQLAEFDRRRQACPREAGVDRDRRRRTSPPPTTGTAGSLMLQSIPAL